MANAKSFFLPGQPTKYARTKSYNIRHLRLELELNFEQHSLSGTASYKVESLAQQLEVLQLDARELNIRAARVNGKSVAFSIQGETLSVKLEPPFTRGVVGEVQLEYAATPKLGLYFRGPTKEHPTRILHAFTQGQAEDCKSWFPSYDYPNMRFTSELLVTTTPEMTAIANGKLLSVTSKGEKKLWHFQQQVPHCSYLLSMIVGQFEKKEQLHDGIQLEYYVPAEQLPNVERSFGKTPKMLELFREKTGLKYPYPKYAQTVVSDFMFGGMENISATTLTERTLHDAQGHLDFTSDNLVSHELAHQWFGDYLTCKDWSHAWLNEGFATYFAALFREHDEGKEDFQYYMHGLRETFSDETHDRYQRPIVTKCYWDPEELFDAHTYEKGAWVLNALRGLLGDAVFFQGIQSYVAKHAVSLVETSEFRSAMEAVSGLELEQFFDQWIYSPGYPEYEAKFLCKEGDKLGELQLEQKNAEVEGVPLFATPLEIRLTLPGNKSLAKKIVLSSQKASFYFALEEKPLNVSIDPQNWILKSLVFEKPLEMYLYQLKHDPNSMERVRAAWALGALKTEEEARISALAFSLVNDSFWGVRLEAAASLGKLATAKALEALLAQRKHADHRTRRGIAIGLRNFAKLPEAELAIDALVDYVHQDYSYYVRAHAANSLGFFPESEKAFAALEAATKQDSVNDQVRYRAFLGLGELKGNSRALALCIEHLKSKGEHPGRQGAARATGKLGKGKPEALEALLAEEHDPDIYVRAEAASSIYYLEDRAALPALEAWLSRELSGRVRRRLRETSYFLQQSLPEKARLATVEAELSKLKEENKELTNKLAKLEERKLQ